jgi:hypothetical protein
MLALVASLALVATAMADQAPSYGAPPPPTYAAAAPTYKEEAHPYQYSYAVADDYSKANFAANEASSNGVVTGSYTVHLPDGRIQTVTYTADHVNGYVADVTYEGTPVYPEAKAYAPPAAYAPAPAAYAPAPAYKAAPAPAYKPAAY